MLKPLILCSVFAAMTPLTAFAQPAATAGAATSAPSTTEYVKKAGQSDQFEIRSGRLAVENASDPALRKFGEEMVKEHETSTKLVMAAAKQDGRTPPAAPPALSSDEDAMLATLKGKMGPSFDDAYLHQQMQAHEAALSLQQSYAASGGDPHLQAAAKKIVPVVKEHISMLNKIVATGGKAM